MLTKSRRMAVDKIVSKLGNNVPGADLIISLQYGKKVNEDMTLARSAIVQ